MPIFAMRKFLKNMFKKLIDQFNMLKKNTNYQKEEYRGTLKQIMKVRGLRTISLSNYNAWRGNEQNVKGIHSLKLDLQSGYLNIFGYRKANKSDKLMCDTVAIENASAETYKKVYNQVMEILKDEGNIPYNVRKNILVRMAR